MTVVVNARCPYNYSPHPASCQVRHALRRFAPRHRLINANVAANDKTSLPRHVYTGTALPLKIQPCFIATAILFSQCIGSGLLACICAAAHLRVASRGHTLSSRGPKLGGLELLGGQLACQSGHAALDAREAGHQPHVPWVSEGSPLRIVQHAAHFCLGLLNIGLQH